MADQKITVDIAGNAAVAVAAPLTAEEQAAYDAAQMAGAAALAAQHQAATDDQTARNAAAAIVQSCVGITWQNLTAAQKQSLVATLLYKAGALDKGLTVQPLAAWLTH